MDLVTAVKLATMRSVTSSSISLFESTMLRYLAGIKFLYKHHAFSPNQHLSLHLGALLRRFGPVHAWRSYPFERWNLVLQSIQTNMRPGELELTMFKRFCRMQTLITFWTDNGLPSAIMESLGTAFQDAFQSDRRGTLQSDLQAMHDLASPFFKVVYAKDGRELNAYERDILRPDLGSQPSDTIIRHESLEYRGVIYKVHEGPVNMNTTGDSHIILGIDVHKPWHPGRLEGIYEVRSANMDPPQTKLLVRMYECLTDRDSYFDLYRAFTVAGGMIYYSSFQARLRLASPGDILSHFALTPNIIESIVRPHIHVLPLDRVSVNFNPVQHLTHSRLEGLSFRNHVISQKAED